MHGSSRFKRGWRLMRDSWRILKADRSLLAFPIVGVATGTLAFVIVAAPGVGVWAATDQWWTALPFAAVALYLTTFATIFAGVGLAAATAQVMDGRDATLRSGLAAARTRTRAIAAWSLLQMTVGLVLNALQSLAESQNGIARIAGMIVTALVSVAWAVASFFVIPLLAFENLSPGAALKRSSTIVRERWGEGVVGSASIGAVVFVLGVLPAGIVIAAGVVLGGPGGVVLIVLGALGLIVAAVVANTLGQVFRVALYRYAIGAPAAPGFAAADLEQAFAPKRGRR